MLHSKHSLHRPGIVLDLWSDEIIHQFYRPPRMITAEKLIALIEESNDIPQLRDVNYALRELHWRRQKQGTMENKLDTLIKVMKKPWYARLKFW